MYVLHSLNNTIIIVILWGKQLRQVAYYLLEIKTKRFSSGHIHAANTRCWYNAGLLLAHRLRRWSNIKPALGQHLVFVGLIIVVTVKYK